MDSGNLRSDPGLDGSEIRQRLDRLERALELLAGTISAHGLPAALREPARLLESLDFPATLVQELLDSVRMALPQDGGSDGAAVLALLARDIGRRVRFRAGLEGLRRPAVVVLAGPPGAGKTSCLVKIAMREAVARRRPAAIVSTDSLRVAASEQLRTYAAILGLPFAVAETPAALRQAVAENAARDLILVDTPGFGRGERDWAAEWVRLLEEIPGRETHLVLPASLRTAEMLDAVKWWSLFSPAALLVTRMDETDRIGGWVSAAIESNLPVRFFSTGQRIPEDFEEASEHRIWQALGVRRGKAAAAGPASGHEQ
jgi:flagellar biosynthesis protein FlhF